MSKRLGLSIMAELNPLAQNFATQMGKLGGTAAKRTSSLFPTTLPRDVNPVSAYFQGAFQQGKSWVSPDKQMSARISTTRKTAAWAAGGLGGANLLDPNSGVTKAGNWMAVTGGVTAGAVAGAPHLWKAANKVGGRAGAAMKASGILLGGLVGAQRLGII